jgi:L-ascorbate metabolism protein UlaG (beta-lactamase superfamily)
LSHYIEGEEITPRPYITGNKATTAKQEDFNGIDAILVTHGSHDHIGDALEIGFRNKCVIFTELGVAKYLRYKKYPKELIKSMIWGSTRNFDGIQIRAVYAMHQSVLDMGSYEYTGTPLGFVIRMENGTGIYFAGDTALYGDLKLYGEIYPAKIGFFGTGNEAGVPVWGMGGEDAALAAKFYGVEVAIPMHCTPGAQEEMDIFRERIAEIAPNIKVNVMKSGDVLEFE